METSIDLVGDYLVFTTSTPSLVQVDDNGVDLPGPPSVYPKAPPCKARVKIIPAYNGLVDCLQMHIYGTFKGLGHEWLHSPRSVERFTLWSRLNRIIRKLLADRYGITRDDLKWYRRCCAKLRKASWHGNPAMSLLDIPAPGTIRFCKFGAHILASVALSLPRVDRDWFQRDIDKLSSQQAVEFLLRLIQELPYGITRVLGIGRNRPPYPNQFHAQHLEAASRLGEQAPKLIRKAAGWVNRMSHREQLIGVCGPWKVPDTPWHGLLSVEAHLNLHRRMDGTRWIGDKDTVLLFPWTYLESKDVQKWITDSSPMTAISVLGWGHFTDNALGPELDMEKDFVPWGHPLDGWSSDTDKVLGKKCGADDSDLDDFDFERYHAFLGLPNKKMWVTQSDILNMSLGYIADGHRIYQDMAGVNGVDLSGRVVKAQPIKGSFSRMLRDAKYNHNILRDLEPAKIEKDKIEGKAPREMWVPADHAGLPAGLEEYRVKDTKALVMHGHTHSTCVGSKAGTADRLYYVKDSVVAEVSFKSRQVLECRDANNKVTDKSLEFQNFLMRYFPNHREECATLGPVHSHLFDEWLEEYLTEFPDKAVSLLGYRQVVVTSTVSICGESLGELAGVSKIDVHGGAQKARRPNRRQA